MKIYKCDKCGKTIELKGNPIIKFPKDWFMVKIFWKPQSKGGLSKGYHLCRKCKEEVFGK